MKLSRVCTRKLLDWSYTLVRRLCVTDVHLSSSFIHTDVPKKPPDKITGLFFHNLVILLYRFTAIITRRLQLTLPPQKSRVHYRLWETVVYYSWMEGDGEDSIHVRQHY